MLRRVFVACGLDRAMRSLYRFEFRTPSVVGSAISLVARYLPMDAAARAASVERLESRFFELVAECRPDLFVEAGAKDARASMVVRELLPSARIVAFEANPYTHARFVKSQGFSSDGPIEYRHLALSDSVGTVTFNVKRRPDGKPRADGQGSLYRADHAPGFEAVVVQATTLDTFFDTSNVRRCAVWMDVEGATELVVVGATQLLAKTDVMFVEVEERPYWGPSQWLRRDVIKSLHASGLEPVHRDWQSRYQHNLLFVRASNAVLMRRARQGLNMKPRSPSILRRAAPKRNPSPHASCIVGKIRTR